MNTVRSFLANLLFLSCVCTVAFADADSSYREGLEAYNRGDLVVAMRLFRLAANDGSVAAQVQLAYILDQAEQNDEAFKLYQAAAQAGSADGQAGLAAMYAKGESTEQNFGLAHTWFERAARQGNETAISVLVAAYENGSMNTEVNIETAAYWRKALADARAAAEPAAAEDR